MGSEVPADMVMVVKVVVKRVRVMEGGQIVVDAHPGGVFLGLLPECGNAA